MKGTTPASILPFLPALLLLLAAGLLFPDRAEAYIDPGTGSIILQFVIAGALGAAYAVKKFWRQIVASIRNLRKKP